MVLGINSFCYPWAVGIANHPHLPVRLDAFGLLQKAKNLGVQAVQYADNLSLVNVSPDDRRKLKEQADEAGIAIEIGMRGTRPEWVRENLALVREFGSNYVRIMPDRGDDFPDAPTILSRLRPLLPECADSGIKLALENIDRFKCRELVAMVEDLGTDNVGVCMDTVNSFGALEGTEVVISTLAPYCVNLHLKDFVLERFPSRLGFTLNGSPAGSGRLDIPSILAVVPQNITCTLELWTPLSDDIEETCAREEQGAIQSVQYLKSIFPT